VTAEAPPLLATKLQAPAVRRELVARGSLINQLRQGATARMTVVTAPPGWGKTTLLAAWRLVEGDHRQFAWVSLDGGDSDPARFWSYVVEALRGASPALEQRLAPLRRIGSGSLADAVVPSIVNALADDHESVVLVLDDFHVIQSPEVHTGVAALVEYAPTALHVALASRGEPAIPLGRLRARGELTELGTDALRFSGREAAVLLNGVLDLGLSDPDVERLHRRTEGWAAGLYLAALSLRGRADPGVFIAEFAGDDRLVFDYLSAEMLDGLRAEVRAFLVQTSILERLCGPLCDAITGRTDSARLLAEIERSNLFLVPLDRRRQWYRYHGLFGELLRRRLELDRPGRAPTLHRRALAWHVDTGTVREAIHHALAADDQAAARELVASHWSRYFNRGRLATVRFWLDALAAEAVRGDPRLSAARAWLALDDGRIDEAEPWILAAERSMAEADVPPSSRAETAVLRAVHAFKAGDVGTAGTAARRAHELAPGDESFSLTVAECVRGATENWAGRPEAATEALEEARRLAREDANDLAEAYAAGYLALVAVEGARLDEADELAAAAIGLSEEPGFAGHFVLHVAHLALAMSCAARGELDGAVASAERAVELAERAGRVEAAAAHLELARARLARGQRAEARSALARAQELLARCADAGVVPARAATLDARLSSARSPATRPGEELTGRELDVLRMLAGPRSRREIAAALYVSPDTVKTHLRGIYRKLPAATRSEAVERARELGLL
jgi:LuxR family maltose regulon positive regulatory protein